MTDGDRSEEQTEDVLPTDDVPREDDDAEGGEDRASGTDTESDDDSSEVRTEDVQPTNNATEGAGDSEGVGGSEGAGGSGDAGDSEGASDVDESESDVDEFGTDGVDGFDESGVGEGVDTDADASVEDVEPTDDGRGNETTDDSGEVIVEADRATESKSDRPKGLAELDRELEEMGASGGEATTTGGGVASVGGQGAINAGQRYCQECGSSISQHAEICPECGVRQDRTQRSNGDSDEVDPGIAALLSFLVPGLGDFYSDETGLGAVMFLAWIAWIAIGWVLIGGGFTLLTFGFGLFLVLPVLLTVELIIHIGAAVISYAAAN